LAYFVISTVYFILSTNGLFSSFSFSMFSAHQYSMLPVWLGRDAWLGTDISASWLFGCTVQLPGARFQAQATGLARLAVVPENWLAGKQYWLWLACFNISAYFQLAMAP
jgi:hypothetical protein